VNVYSTTPSCWASVQPLPVATSYQIVGSTWEPAKSSEIVTGCTGGGSPPDEVVPVVGGFVGGAVAVATRRCGRAVGVAVFLAVVAGLRVGVGCGAAGGARRVTGRASGLQAMLSRTTRFFAVPEPVFAGP